MNHAIGMHIGDALFGAGYTFNTLNVDDRQAIAAQALREVGYPESEV